MKKMIQKGLVLCLAAAVLGGCGSEDERKVGLEDIRQSLSDGQQGMEVDAGQGSDGSFVSEEAGESSPEASENGGENSSGVSENGGGDAGQDSAGGQDSTEGQDSAGGQDSTEGQDSTGGQDSTEGQDSAGGQDSTGGQDAPGQALSPEQEAMYKAYVTVLEDVYFDGKFPGYADYGPSPEGYDVSDNMFAVFDVDFDGREELIISYTATYSAGMVEIVYGYDSSTGSVQQELLAYPHLTYYDNGVVEEMASHNHGMAGDGGADGNFWPYSLRRYDAEADTYVPVGSVDAWSKGFREEDYDGNPFPEDADTDGDGVVYYVMEGDYALIDPMDGAEYNQWRDSYLKGTKQVQIPYVNLTTDNIYAIVNGIDIMNGIAITDGIANTNSNGNADGRMAVPEGLTGKQISDQSFTVTLDGWGEVTFAPFEPEGVMEDGRGQMADTGRGLPGAV